MVPKDRCPGPVFNASVSGPQGLSISHLATVVYSINLHQFLRVNTTRHRALLGSLKKISFILMVSAKSNKCIFIISVCEWR